MKRDGTYLFTFIVLLSGFIYFNDRPIEWVRTSVVFALTPAWFLYANHKRLWFRNRLRWMLKLRHHTFFCTVLFTVFVLLSYPALAGTTKGIIIHLVLLTFGSIAYWAPLLISCSFAKSPSFMKRFSFFILTSIFFFVYHQAAFFFNELPSKGFLHSGLLVMGITLFILVTQWGRAEQHTDRPTVRGYTEKVHPPM